MDPKNPLHGFQHGFSAPVTGITPSTQVGRLSGSHSDIGFLLINSQVEKGEGTARRKVQEFEDVSTMVWCTSAVHERAAAESGRRRRFRGKYRGTTMETNKERVESQLVEQFLQVHTGDQSVLPTPRHSFVALSLPRVAQCPCLEP